MVEPTPPLHHHEYCWTPDSSHSSASSADHSYTSDQHAEMMTDAPVSVCKLAECGTQTDIGADFFDDFKSGWPIIINKSFLWLNYILVLLACMYLYAKNIYARIR